MILAWIKVLGMAMRLRGFEVKKVGPIKLVAAENLSDIVVLAGPNGVGKTSINNALLNLVRSGSEGTVSMRVEATDNRERVAWKKSLLDTKNPEDFQTLIKTLRKNQRRNQYKSSFLNFDSNRAIRNIKGYNFGWDIGDPFAEDTSWEFGLNSLSNRYNDVWHSLFRLVEAQRRKIAETAIGLRASGATTMNLDFPDLLEPFKTAFWRLLAPKRLIDVSVREQQIYYEHEGKKFPLASLSSGESEVVNILFDFILRNPEDSIIVFDEPELHLHPELTYKLLQTLAQAGHRNQFIFSSHSPDIISASLDHTVLFISPPRDDATNQAIVVNRDDQTHHALQSLGQSIGVISLGKKLVLIEGQESSLDKQTYGSILKGKFPEFVLVPVGGKDTVRSFEDVQRSVINKTIWGVDFFLLCDRDAAQAFGRNAVEKDTSARIRQLPRYHLENYFFDETVLADVFSRMESEHSWLRDPSSIRTKLRQIASSVVSYTVALNVNAAIREQAGNVSIVPKGIDNISSVDELLLRMTAKVDAERERIARSLDDATIKELAMKEYQRLLMSIDQDSPEWKVDIPGRIILHKFAALVALQPGRLKQLYLNSPLAESSFQEIVQIFSGFRGVI